YELLVVAGPPSIDVKVVVNSPSEVLKPLSERGKPGECLRITITERHQHPDETHPTFSRGGSDGPDEWHARESTHNLPPVHSMTSSASCCRCRGTSSPSGLAVLRLITNSNFVGCCTGRSAGLAPLRMRSTYEAERRKMS